MVLKLDKYIFFAIMEKIKLAFNESLIDDESNQTIFKGNMAYK